MTPTNKIETVYNIEVEGDNSYVADGIIVHNCQDFSIAGLRAGLDGERGNLSLQFIGLLGRLRPKYFVWENVPGFLSSNSGRDAAAFLGGLTGKLVSVPRNGKWKNFGVIQGIDSAYSIAWRVLDAQYFGVPQRRRRVFVVGCLGADWRRACAILLERYSLQGNTPPSQKKGKEPSSCFDTSSSGNDAVSVSPTIDVRVKNGPIQNQIGLAIMGYSAYTHNQHPLLRAEGGDCGGGSEALIVMSSGQGGADPEGDFGTTLTCNHEAPILFETASSAGWPAELAPTLDCSFSDKYGYDNQHVNSGAGLFVPGDPIVIKTSDTGSNGSNFTEDGVAYTIDTTNGQAIANVVSYGIDEECNAREEQFGSLMRGGDGGTRQTVVSIGDIKNFQTSQSGVRLNDTMGTLDANYGGRRLNGIMCGASVRRLTPVECARLQGFPDHHTALRTIRYMKPNLRKIEEQAFMIGRTLEQELDILARRQGISVEEYLRRGEIPDGPQYKAYGNSMAVPVIRWIGERIQMLEDLEATWES